MTERVTLDDLIETVTEDVHENAAEPDITIEALFPRELMRTGYFYADSITDFFETAPVEKPTGEYHTISSPEFNEYVQTHTVFDSWDEMLRYAAQEWVAREWEAVHT